MSILVTGAAGFVGINIVRQLATHGAAVIALARQEPDAAIEDFLAAVRSQVRFVRGDVRDRDALAALIRQAGIERIVHGAAVTPTPADAQANPALVVDVNLGGTLNVLEAARQGRVQRVVLISSSAVYGAPADRTRLITEEQPLQISNLYTICKQASEELCHRYRDLFGLSTVVGRLGTAYGPMERGTASRQRMSPIHVLLHAALAGRPVRLYGTDLLRDVCHVIDMAEAFARLALADQLSWAVYNVSAGTSHTLAEIVDVLKDLMPGFVWETTADPAQADIAVLPANERGPLDISRLRHDLDFAPRYELRDGMQHYLAWLRNHNSM